MDVVAPESLIFWTTVIFIIFLFLLKKFAWKPILSAVKSREESINIALASAEAARNEMKSLKADNEKILQEARAERDAMIKEARDIKEAMIAEAKLEAQQQGEKIIAQAKTTIESEKNAAMSELKNHISSLSIEIAEKLLKNQLSDKESQVKLVDKMLDEVELN